MAASLADMLEIMAEAGASPEMLVAAARRHEERDAQRKAEIREQARQRKRKQRAKEKAIESGIVSRVTPVTSRDIRDQRDDTPHAPPPNAPQTPKTPPPISPPDCPDGQLSPASGDVPAPIDETAEALEAYRRVAKRQGWPDVRVFNRQRRSALTARLREFSLAEWGEVLRNAAASPHCNGQNGRGWTANFDFLVSPSGFAKTLEGNYAGSSRAREPACAGPGRDKTAVFSELFEDLPAQSGYEPAGADSASGDSGGRTIDLEPARYGWGAQAGG